MTTTLTAPTRVIWQNNNPASRMYLRRWPGEDRWCRVVDVERVMWLDRKIHIFKGSSQARNLWWMRCDCCLERSRRAFGVADDYAGIIKVVQRHARLIHSVAL